MSVKSGPRRLRGFERRFDGWQPGLVAVLLAWATAVLVVPRPIPPVDVPEPAVSPGDVAALRAREGQRAQRARASLSPPIRALGSAIRAVGIAEARRDGKQLGAARQAISSALRTVPSDAFEELAALRAYQTKGFVAAVRAWADTGARTDELDELGGALVDVVAPGCAETGRPRLTMDDDELGAAYRKRWGKLLGAREGDLQPSLLEERLLFVHALRHPRTDLTVSEDPRTGAALAAQALLRRVEQHGAVDPEYPVELARGVALYRGGQFARAVQAFERHLARHPDGPHAARARNHVRAAMQAELGDPPSGLGLSL